MDVMLLITIAKEVAPLVKDLVESHGGTVTEQLAEDRKIIEGDRDALAQELQKIDQPPTPPEP